MAKKKKEPFKPANIVEAGQIPKGSTPFKPPSGGSAAAPFKQAPDLVKAGQVPGGVRKKTGELTTKPLEELQFTTPEQQAKEQLPGAALSAITLLPGGRVLKGRKILSGKAAERAIDVIGLIKKQAADVARQHKAAGIDVKRFIVPAAKIIGNPIVARKAAAGTILRTRVGVITKDVAIGGRIVTNTVTEKLTATWLAKLAAKAKSPEFVVIALLGAIGSYPFAGFIKEEALQTLGFGVRSAISNEDIEGAELAISKQEEILNPDLWGQIFAAIPTANILVQLHNFYESALIKVSIDKRVIRDMKIKEETNETETDKWTRIRQEELDSKNAAVDYYNEERKKQLDWERRHGYRATPFINWNKEQKEETKNITLFYNAYRNRATQISQKTRTANLTSLNFGLL